MFAGRSWLKPRLRSRTQCVAPLASMSLCLLISALPPFFILVCLSPAPNHSSSTLHSTSSPILHPFQLPHRFRPAWTMLRLQRRLTTCRRSNSRWPHQPDTHTHTHTYTHYLSPSLHLRPFAVLTAVLFHATYPMTNLDGVCVPVLMLCSVL